LITNSVRKLAISFILVSSAFIAAHLGFWFLPNVFETWNLQTVDQFFVLRSASERLRPLYDNTIVHVDFTNSSIERLDELYLNRSHYARVIRNLASMQVAAQVYDFIFAARSDEQHDAALVRATEEAGNVYFGLALKLRHQNEISRRQQEHTQTIRYLDRTKWDLSVKGDPAFLYEGGNPLATFVDLASTSRGLGSVSVRFDRDGVLRRVPLVVLYRGAYYPNLSFRVVCDYLGVPPENILLHPGRHVVLQGAKKPGDEKPHDIVIPIDRHGNMIINYVGPWERMDHYEFADVFMASDDRDELAMWREELSGKIAIISDVSTGSTDVGPVPTDTNYPLTGAHANVMHGILTESFLRELSGWETLGLEMLLMAGVLFLSLRFSSLYFSVGTVSVAALYLVIASGAFFYGHLIPHIIRPLLMIGFAMVSIIVYRYINEEKEKLRSLRQRDFIRDTFGRYLSNEVVEELLGSSEGLKMTGEMREITFLVSDLRGFTALTLKLSPREVIEIINRYFERMVDIIVKHRGTVNEFQGDGILTFFGAPLAADDDPERAVACAIEMQNALIDVNAEQRRLNLPELAMGIGLNTGDVVVGNIGSERRVSYGAVGSPINIAYRIESFTIGGQILISPSTYAKVQSIVQVRGTKEARLKGIDHPVRLYDVLGMAGRFQVTLNKKTDDSLIKLDSPLPIMCFLIEDKTISESPISGHILQIGETSAEVLLKQQVEVYADLIIRLTFREARNVPDTYAKVLPRKEAASLSSGESTLLHFTWLPQEAKKLLGMIRSSP
jgi:class 3 adenylate cyclase/CHASE2 domain-containing sensor protein